MSYRSTRHEPTRELGERIQPLRRTAGDNEDEMAEDRGDWLIVQSCVRQVDLLEARVKGEE